MVLVDTSVWIATFKKNGLDLQSVVDFGRIVTCLPVLQEVLQGFRDERAFRLARESMFALPRVEDPLGHDVVEEAVQLYRLARRRGATVRSSTDCLIAACAIRHDLEVLHRDRDYLALARLCGLKQKAI